MTIHTREMQIDDYEDAWRLWEQTPGMGLSSADEEPAIACFLQRNPGLCFVACEGGKLVGTALCGHDGRRGYVYHVAVAETHRMRGIAKRLVACCLDGLRRQGIEKAHLMVYETNPEGIAFWHKLGWYRRDELAIMSVDLGRIEIPD
jgi:ribosomal protein S18 acetylase RimI-like enzyme